MSAERIEALEARNRELSEALHEANERIAGEYCTGIPAEDASPERRERYLKLQARHGLGEKKTVPCFDFSEPNCECAKECICNECLARRAGNNEEESK